MKGIGIFALVVGSIWFVSAFNSDTTVPVPGIPGYSSASRIHNIGLMDQRRNHLLIAGGIAFAGVILLGFGSIAKPTDEDAENDITKRKCPTCAEFVKVEAIVCRFCNHALPPLPTPAELAAQAEAEMKKAEQHVALSAKEKAIADEKKPKGICPNCEQLIPIDTVECKCGARFGPMSTWKIKPV